MKCLKCTCKKSVGPGKIEECQHDKSKDFGTVDYCDSYRITKSTNDNAGQIAARMFKLPGWVKGLMMLRHWMVKPFGLKTGGGAKQGEIFPVIAQNENEIIMGINDSHLNFRVSVLLDREKSYICTTTLVHYNNGWGKAYFLLVKPFHKIKSSSTKGWKS
jgi:hypothetical protein